MKNIVPIGKKVSKPLQEKIVELLRKYAGAENSSKFNLSLLCFALEKDAGKWIDDNHQVLFGEVITERIFNPAYYPVCMWHYYMNECKPFKGMFQLNEDFSKRATRKIPEPATVMNWFYKKHKHELIGLIK